MRKRTKKLLKDEMLRKVLFVLVSAALIIVAAQLNNPTSHEH